MLRDEETVRTGTTTANYFFVVNSDGTCYAEKRGGSGESATFQLFPAYRGAPLPFHKIVEIRENEGDACIEFRGRGDYAKKLDLFKVELPLRDKKSSLWSKIRGR